MNLKAVLLSLMIATPVFADLDKAYKLVEQEKWDEVKIELLKIVKSAKAGDAKSQLELGVMKSEGLWLIKDNKEAIEWWKKSAEQGYVPAQVMMGAVYLGGVRTDKDLEKADKWFNKAIELDNGLVDLVKALKALAIEKENRVEQ
jgi:TPR repeat protein